MKKNSLKILIGVLVVALIGGGVFYSNTSLQQGRLGKIAPLRSKKTVSVPPTPNPNTPATDTCTNLQQNNCGLTTGCVWSAAGSRGQCISAPSNMIRPTSAAPAENNEPLRVLSIELVASGNLSGLDPYDGILISYNQPLEGNAPYLSRGGKAHLYSFSSDSTYGRSSAPINSLIRFLTGGYGTEVEISALIDGRNVHIAGPLLIGSTDPIVSSGNGRGILSENGVYYKDVDVSFSLSNDKRKLLVTFSGNTPSPISTSSRVSFDAAIGCEADLDTTIVGANGQRCPSDASFYNQFNTVSWEYLIPGNDQMNARGVNCNLTSGIGYGCIGGTW